MRARESVSLRLVKAPSKAPRSSSSPAPSAPQSRPRRRARTAPPAVNLEDLPRIPISELLPPPFARLATASPALASVFTMAALLAPTQVAVVIEGARESGKEALARCIHEASRRAAGPFVVVNCRSYESESAGEGRASTFARALEKARGGTLVLDEPGALDLDAQDALLAALAVRDGARPSPRGLDVRAARARVIATTTVDLEEMVHQGRLREALFLELADARLALPTDGPGLARTGAGMGAARCA